MKLTATGTNAGVVSPRGPRKGAVKIYVDGVYRGSVSLYARTSRPRSVIFRTALHGSGTHVVKLVNAPRSGRAQFDLDGFELLR